MRYNVYNAKHIHYIYGLKNLKRRKKNVYTLKLILKDIKHIF